MNLPYQRGWEILRKAQEKDAERHVWEEWLTLYPLMIKKQIKFISFPEYLSKRMTRSAQRSVKVKSSKDLLEFAEKVKQADSLRHSSPEKR